MFSIFLITWLVFYGNLLQVARKTRHVTPVLYGRFVPTLRSSSIMHAVARGFFVSSDPASQEVIQYPWNENEVNRKKRENVSLSRQRVSVQYRTVRED